MRKTVPVWTMEDIKKAKEFAASIEGGGSTTPILDRYGIQQQFKGPGRVYVDADRLMEVFQPILGENCPDFQPFNDLPGPLPWNAEISLKNSFKKLFDK